MLDGIREIYATRGKSVEHIRLDRDSPKPAELARLMLGPTGNLRAPTVRIKQTLIVGFDPQLYERMLDAK